MSETNSDKDKKLVDAHKTMVERVRKTMDEEKQETTPKVLHALENAKEKAIELGEVTREEAELVSDYIVRDLHDAADFIERNRAEFKDWLNLEMDIIEDTILDSLPPLVDETRLALDQLKHRADSVGEWHTGEIVSPGKFICKSCDKTLEIHKTGHIPPCPSCKGTKFRRQSTQ
ncbi:MAG: zinc ribbon-containing protein [Gammaproteobacteria bacterium]|jgi:hypothetical protein